VGHRGLLFVSWTRVERGSLVENQMELGIVQCGIGSYGIDTGNSDNSEDARRQTERCFDRQLVDIIEMTPLTLTDRRMYNFLLANAWDKIAEPVQHVIPKRELQNTLHKGTDRLEDSRSPADVRRSSSFACWTASNG
jgi:hypothetical protein